MLYSSAIVPILAAAAAAASPVELRPRSNSGAAQCRDFYANITASASNVDISPIIGGQPANQQVLIEGSISVERAGSTIMQQIAAAPKMNVSGTYSLWFEYCTPTNGTAKGLFQTIHGIVGNAGYWNVQLNGSQNSFADAAAEAGWATLSYDRLGVGRSAHPDGISVVQINYEIAQAVAINAALRAGNLSDVGQHNKIVAVGHSYGSVMLAGVASVAPTIFDAIVFTGFSNNITNGPLGVPGFQSTLANYAYPSRFANLTNSYVITPSVSNDQIGFFHYPNYTQAALDKFTTTKGEYTIGQQMTTAGPYSLSRPNFTKPVFVISGNEDGPFCSGNCTVTSRQNGTQLDTARSLFPAVADSNFTTYVVPDTGHGINFHTTAYSAYQQILQFVQKTGI